MNPWAIAIGAALGAVRAQSEERAAHEQRKVESTKSRWATFTGRAGQNVQQVDHMGRIMQGGMTGAMMGQQLGGGEQGAAAAPAVEEPNPYAMPNAMQRPGVAQNPNAWRSGV